MFKKVLDLFKKWNSVAIITHYNADGDAFGSALMLHEFLTLNFPNIDKDIFTETATITENFSIMLGDMKINPERKKYAIAIAVDCADTGRFSKYNEIFATAKYTVNIDHHQDNAYYADLNFVAPTSSNCENLYNLLKSTNLQMNKKIASFACVGVLTDTNALSVPTVTDKTYALVSEFYSLDVDVFKIRKMFFGGYNKTVYDLIATALTKTEFICNNRVMFIVLNRSDLKRCNATESDVGAIINTIFSLSKSLACFLVSPREKEWHVSMRSIDGINVNMIAKSMDGGGH